MIKDKREFLPRYAIIPLLFCFLINDIVYFVIRIFREDAYHYDFTTDLDRLVPFVPAWVSIYLICYIFWIVNYILISRQGKEHMYRFVTADVLSRLVCGLFFWFLPTTNVRPDITGTGIWDTLMALVYRLDAPTNLFPSIHCLTSWFCYIGIRGQSGVPVWYQRFSLVFALLVCLSTQFTKQHYLVDMIGGVALAQVCYFCSMRFDWYLPVRRIFENINGIIFRRKA